ncbi:redoxin domain-containing protein [Nannocystis punicea]|uniref:Redoxin domain-containing protein n=1 Tax=Nannocystis punicea TaxID=2995304 RepID=A0ABY7GRN9_9BACT|nr:redoxin family protein [Nannocystis poenicansa]WAS89622.1 redoxin domain-containing protein [Nannocystis poenicansa]
MTPRTLLALALALTACDGAKPPAAAGTPTKTPPADGDAKAATPTPAPPANPLADPAAVAAIGKPAPDFTLPTADGKTIKLSDLRGKTVVLEWFNPECPFVKAAHDAGPLKDLATKTTTATPTVTWLAINSGAPGKQGHGAEANQAAAKNWSMAHPILLDETGAVGHAYGATNTPHMYIVDAQGALVYRGGLDNAPMNEPEGGARVALFEDALAAVLGSKPVEQADTRAWGCTVKYAK